MAHESFEDETVAEAINRDFIPIKVDREAVSYTHLILGDIGGWNGFVSSVYLAGPGPFLYHLYDDRGLDVLGRCV